MSENIKNTTEAVRDIIETVPIYEDLLQPAIQELGNGLHTLSKTVHIALSPVSALIWGYDQIKLYIQSSLEEKLQNIPKENIISPDPTIAGPALEALRYSGHKEELRGMFSNLIATAMNSDVASTAHPSFVEIIKQINPDEAKLIEYIGHHNYLPLINVNRTVPGGDGEATIYRNFTLAGYEAGCMFTNLVPSYIDNLHRLGVIEIPDGRLLTPEEKYKSLEKHPFMVNICSEIEKQNATPVLQKRYFYLTNFGTQFYNACI